MNTYLKTVIRAKLPGYLGALMGITISTIYRRVHHHLVPMDWSEASGIVIGSFTGWFGLASIHYLWTQHRSHKSEIDSI